MRGYFRKQQRGSADSLRQWSSLPAVSVPLIAYVVPTTEVWLAMRWWGRCRRPPTLVLALVMLSAFTIAYAVEFGLRADPPACACLGLWREYLGRMAEGESVIVRNLVLLVVMSLAGLVDVRDSDPARRAAVR